MTAPFAYDVVDYPSSALWQMHPGHLDAVACMYGANAVPADRCRMLEVGCGEGVHLIHCALTLPQSKFVGIDLSTVAIARGNAMIAELGLTNVELHTADLTQWEPPAEPFDYACAHGFYSWVPSFVRDALMQLYEKVLTPEGIGYISYNTYPGCYMRRMLWEMLRFHSAEHNDPRAKIESARQMASFLIESLPLNKDSAKEVFAEELERILLKQGEAILYHDDLAVVNDPVYFHEFAAHAGRFGLRFVAEAEHHMMATHTGPEKVSGILTALAEEDVLRKEQYIDFVKLRRFRETILSRDGGTPRAEPDPTKISDLYFSGQPQAEGAVNLAEGVIVAFKGPRGAGAQLDSALGKAALVAMKEAWPRRIAFADLLQRASSKLGRSKPTPADVEMLATILASVWRTAMFKLHGDNPEYCPIVNERPVACPLARIQARNGPVATTRLCQSMRFDDTPSRKLLECLDGTRNHDQIAVILADAFPPESRPTPDVLKQGVKANLARLAEAGLLVG